MQRFGTFAYGLLVLIESWYGERLLSSLPDCRGVYQDFPALLNIEGGFEEFWNVCTRIIADDVAGQRETRLLQV